MARDNALSSHFLDIDTIDVARIVAAAEALANDPFPQDSVKLTGNYRRFLIEDRLRRR